MSHLEKVIGAFGSYSPLLVGRADNWDDADNSATYAWRLAERIAGVRLNPPPFNRKNSMLPDKYAVDYMVGSGKILCVEDNPVSMKLLLKTLGPLGEKALMAKDGLEAFKSIEEGHDIRLVLLDLSMPNMDGWEFMESLAKTYPQDERCFPIVIISEVEDYAAVKRAMSFGALGYKKKPYKPDELWTVLADSLFAFKEACLCFDKETCSCPEK